MSEKGVHTQVEGEWTKTLCLTLDLLTHFSHPISDHGAGSYVKILQMLLRKQEIIP